MRNVLRSSSNSYPQPSVSISQSCYFFCRWQPGWMTHWAPWRPNWSTAPSPSPSCRASASCRCTAVPSIPAPSWRTASTGGGCYIMRSAAVTEPLPERGSRPSPIIPFCFSVPNTDSVSCSESVFESVIYASFTWPKQKHLWIGNLQMIEWLTCFNRHIHFKIWKLLDASDNLSK